MACLDEQGDIIGQLYMRLADYEENWNRQHMAIERNI